MYPLLHDQENGSSRPKLIGGLEKNFQHSAYRQRNRDTHISGKSSGWQLWDTKNIFCRNKTKYVSTEKSNADRDRTCSSMCVSCWASVSGLRAMLERSVGIPVFSPSSCRRRIFETYCWKQNKKNIYGAYNAKNSLGFGERENDVLATRLPNLPSWGARPPSFSIRGTRPPGQAPTHMQAHLTLCFSTAVKCLSRDCSSWVNLKTKQNSAIIGYLKMSMYHCLI